MNNININDNKLNVIINDKRENAEFKGITFSNFQKSKVMHELIQCIVHSKI
jgi:hypothetical protein